MRKKIMTSDICRRIIVMVTILLLSTVTIVAQNIRIHVVSEGETMTSIAKKYSVSKETILQINPESSRGVFPGMELQIPYDEKTRNNQIEDKSVIEDNRDSAFSDVNTNTGRWVISVSSGMVIGDKEDDNWDSSLGMKISVGTAYKVTDNFYASFRLGYFGIKKWVNTKVENYSVNIESNFHALNIPFEIGYMIGTGNTSRFAITPFAGIEMNIGISGKTESEYGKEKQKVDEKIGGKTAMGAEAGLKVSFGNDLGFKLGVIVPIDKKYKYWYGEGTGFVIAICSVF